MSNIFKENLVERIKTDPVMNSVWQNPMTPMVTYQAHLGVERNPTYDRRITDPTDRRHYKWLVEEENAIINEEFGFVDMPSWRRWQRPGKKIWTGTPVHFWTNNDRTRYFDKNFLGDLMNLKYVDKEENPQLQRLRGAKIRVSNAFQSFSSQ